MLIYHTMRIATITISIFIILFIAGCNSPEPKLDSDNYAIVIHGGAGNFSINDIPEKDRAKYISKLDEALLAGKEVLKNGGKALDAVESCIRVLEDSPLFNAGKGAVFTNAGTNEMDASIMDGSKIDAGAVAGVKRIKNPISAARAVMEKSKHVMLSGDGADKFAAKIGLDTVSPDYFYTDKRWEQLQRIQEKEKNKLDSKMGTVGCVALDKDGNIAAGTSTGGMGNKMFGRIGDSPIIGCGTYANNNTCGISFTGHGEYIIRYVAAYDISALMEYKKLSLKQAMSKVISEKLKENGGEAGAIGIDKYGNIEIVFNTTGMFRALLKSDGTKEISIGE